MSLPSSLWQQPSASLCIHLQFFADVLLAVEAMFCRHPLPLAGVCLPQTPPR
jgi:hypothetical protein